MKKLGLFLLIAVFCSACGARIPSEVKTASIARKYFAKYGKKYPQTVFGQNKVSEVQVDIVKELQKDLANSLVRLKLDNGTEVPIILTMIRKYPRGWRASGWEMVHQERIEPDGRVVPGNNGAESEAEAEANEPR